MTPLPRNPDVHQRCSRTYARLTFSARGPLGPCPVSNITACPSRNSSNRIPEHAD